MDNKKIVKAMEIAEKKFAMGFNCAESALIGITSAINLKSDMFPRIATGFGGGVSRYGSVCGALSGAVMAIGAFCGRDTLNDPDERQKFYELVSLLNEDFINKFSFINCRDLTGCDLLTKEGRNKFDTEGIRQKKCNEFVKFAARKGVEILNNK